jgi:hypothetical protein
MVTTGIGYLADRPDIAAESNGSVMDSDQMSIIGRGEDN